MKKRKVWNLPWILWKNSMAVASVFNVALVMDVGENKMETKCSECYYWKNSGCALGPPFTKREKTICEKFYSKKAYKEEEERDARLRRQIPNYATRSDEIDESYLSRRWHFEH